jgi:type II secretory pathway pseudopilin PulG
MSEPSNPIDPNERGGVLDDVPAPARGVDGDNERADASEGESGTRGVADEGAQAPPADGTQPADDELSRAAREARAGPYIPGGHFKPPNSLKILLLVVACLVGGAIYFIVFAVSGIQRTEKVRQKTLELKSLAYDQQQQYLKDYGFLPAGATLKPLTADERAELEGLRARYGKMAVANPKAPKPPPGYGPAATQPNAPPTSGPAAAPAGAG